MTVDKKKSPPKWLTKIHQFFKQKNQVVDTETEIIDQVVVSDAQKTENSNQVKWDDIESLVKKTILALQIVLTVLVQVRSLSSLNVRSFLDDYTKDLIGQLRVYINRKCRNK